MDVLKGQLNTVNIEKIGILLKDVYQQCVQLYSDSKKWKKLFKAKSDENDKLNLQINELQSKLKSQNEQSTLANASTFFLNSKTAFNASATNKNNVNIAKTAADLTTNNNNNNVNLGKSSTVLATNGSNPDLQPETNSSAVSETSTKIINLFPFSDEEEDCLSSDEVAPTISNRLMVPQTQDFVEEYECIDLTEVLVVPETLEMDVDVSTLSGKRNTSKPEVINNNCNSVIRTIDNKIILDSGKGRSALGKNDENCKMNRKTINIDLDMFFKSQQVKSDKSFSKKKMTSHKYKFKNINSDIFENYKKISNNSLNGLNNDEFMKSNNNDKVRNNSDTLMNIDKTFNSTTSASILRELNFSPEKCNQSNKPKDNLVRPSLSSSKPVTTSNHSQTISNFKNADSDKTITTKTEDIVCEEPNFFLDQTIRTPEHSPNRSKLDYQDIESKIRESDSKHSINGDFIDLDVTSESFQITNESSESSNLVKKEMLTNSVNMDKKRKTEADYAYVDVVRKKHERDLLTSIPCEQCTRWFQDMGISQSEQAERMKSCRHKFRYEPPSTPENYWTIGFPDTQMCKDKGYMGEDKVNPSKFRRKKELRKMF